MPYPAVPSRRMPYDIDGTEISWNPKTSTNPSAWLTDTQKSELNSNDGSDFTTILAGVTSNVGVWFFLPEKREITHLACVGRGKNSGQLLGIRGVYGSNDTTNGTDGTWETAVFPNGVPALTNWDENVTLWRSGIEAISFSEPKKVLKIVFGADNVWPYIQKVHIYGQKAVTETPDDILILDDTLVDDPEFTALKDWGDRPEGTTLISSVRLKNASPTKTANNINLQLNHDDFLISFDQAGPWGTVLDITSLTPEAISSSIYIKNQIAPPLQMLGPKAARLIVSVGSWT